MTDAQTALAQTLAGAQALADLANSLSTQNNSLSAANVQLQAQVDAGQQTISGLNKTIADQSATIADLTAKLAALQPKPAPEPPTPVDPWFLVDRTGTKDVTAQLQALINTTPVPAGKYLIDAVKGIKVTGQAKLDPNAILIAKPNAQPRYCMVDVAAGASITGGQLIGDRDQHDYTTITSTHEWGYGLFLRGKNAKATNVRVSKCTGDGVGVKGDNAVLQSVVSTGNRRQGCSVFSCTGFRAYDCEFSDTSGAPNGPCAGVDFEPDSGSVVDAKLIRCKTPRNRAGVLGWLRSEVAGTLDVELIDCDITDCSNGVWAKDAGNRAGSVKVRLTQTRLARNSGNSIKADAGSVVTVGDSTQANANTFNAGTVLKLGQVGRYDVALLNGGKASLGWNKVP